MNPLSLLAGPCAYQAAPQVLVDPELLLPTSPRLERGGSDVVSSSRKGFSTSLLITRQ